MIKILDKHNCCGCSACEQVCSKQCISFDEDEQGFRYPLVHQEQCVNCRLCEIVCPMQNCLVLKSKRLEEIEPLRVVAAYSKNELLREKSSSGGIFSILAKTILDEGGVVFGARFNENFEVVHGYLNSEERKVCKEGEDDNDGTLDYLELLSPFRGAKYSQSIIGDTYKQARDFLKAGRMVLFSGTGCQIAGLKLFLRKEYDNLLTVEIACHGVPSPRIWREYIKYISNGKEISDIIFRDKRNGWNDYGLSIKGGNGEIFYERAFTNDFMQCFLNDLCVRPSCSKCPAKAGMSGADLLIGDFWGIDGMHPEMYDNKGCSLVIAYSERGKQVFESLNTKYIETTYEEAYRYNPCIIHSSRQSRYAPIFWRNYKKHGIKAVPETLKILRSGRFQRMILLGWYRLFNS